MKWPARLNIQGKSVLTVEATDTPETSWCWWNVPSSVRLTCCLWRLCAAPPGGPLAWAGELRVWASTGQEVCVCRCILGNVPPALCTAPRRPLSESDGEWERRSDPAQCVPLWFYCGEEAVVPPVCAEGKPQSSSARPPWSRFPRWEDLQLPCGHARLLAPGDIENLAQKRSPHLQNLTTHDGSHHFVIPLMLDALEERTGDHVCAFVVLRLHAAQNTHGFREKKHHFQLYKESHSWVWSPPCTGWDAPWWSHLSWSPPSGDEKTQDWGISCRKQTTQDKLWCCSQC